MISFEGMVEKLHKAGYRTLDYPGYWPPIVDYIEATKGDKVFDVVIRSSGIAVSGALGTFTSGRKALAWMEAQYV